MTPPDTPRGLRQYRTVPPPKFKKDYGGQLVRVPKMPPLSYYDLELSKHAEKPDPLIPNNAVFTLRARYTNGIDGTGKSQAQLVCDWPCPCCGHKHERIFQDSMLEEGKAEFVEETSHLTPGNSRVVYLAAPYTHPDSKVRQQRWIDACDAAAELMRMGYAVLSPISMGHPIAVRGQDAGIGGDWQAWQAACLAMMAGCSHFAVLQTEGWEHSVGVGAEVDHAHKLGLPLWAMTDIEGHGYGFELQPNMPFAGGAE